jgi:hypothetical protein
VREIRLERRPRELRRRSVDVGERPWARLGEQRHEIGEVTHLGLLSCCPGPCGARRAPYLTNRMPRPYDVGSVHGETLDPETHEEI